MVLRPLLARFLVWFFLRDSWSISKLCLLMHALDLERNE